MANKALLNYYARLVHREIKTWEEVPTDIRDQVREIEATLPPYIPDPETTKPTIED